MYNCTPLTNLATSMPAIVARSVIASRNSDPPTVKNLQIQPWGIGTPVFQKNNHGHLRMFSVVRCIIVGNTSCESTHRTLEIPLLNDRRHEQCGSLFRQIARDESPDSGVVRTLGRLVRWSNSQPFRLRFCKLESHSVSLT